ncbi:D-hexose-6-phosphate mutarotase [Aestuariibacter salexigens]|uniref:D-hexose-6-phosphate mutarotase n=1 Tax=Aestuariibacter salexigens TaxID=226010 RepID=UPI000427329E|nr:D-hexose-6-phosphate mutarotase [Aestuariibacter salexigens]
MQLPSSITQASRGSLDTLVLSNAFGRCEISLFGAHVLSYVPQSDQRERLWLSQSAIFDGISAIRGGVPVCWPWFSDNHGNRQEDLPSHGYVRKQQWTLNDCKDDDNGTAVTLVPQSVQGPGFDYAAQLKIVVHLGEQLSITLVTRNLGSEPFPLSCALHTYFAVEDIQRSELIGLKGEYLDKTRGFDTFSTPSPYRFTMETDRIHLDAAEHLTIQHPGGVTEVDSSGHNSIVVWNPWQDKATAMADMREDGYLTMLCVETAVTGDVSLAPGQTLALQQRIG